MKFFTKELISLTTLLVGGYLILTHATGFSRSLGAASSAYGGVVKSLQGR